jgi:hypothetical protein
MPALTGTPRHHGARHGPTVGEQLKRKQLANRAVVGSVIGTNSAG